MIFQVLVEHHYPSVKRIYEQGIATGLATFETAAPEWEEWNKTYLSGFRVIGIEKNEMIGWAALKPVSVNPEATGVAEVMICVDEQFRRKGYGTHLLDNIIQWSETAGLWTLQVGIFQNNTSAIRMYEALGFREIGYREKVSKLNGEWQNVVLFERRSAKNGRDKSTLILSL